jgi:hypothetical protein
MPVHLPGDFEGGQNETRRALLSRGQLFGLAASMRSPEDLLFDVGALSGLPQHGLPSVTNPDVFFSHQDRLRCSKLPDSRVTFDSSVRFQDPIPRKRRGILSVCLPKIVADKQSRVDLRANARADRDRCLSNEVSLVSKESVSHVSDPYPAAILLGAAARSPGAEVPPTRISGTLSPSAPPKPDGMPLNELTVRSGKYRQTPRYTSSSLMLPSGTETPRVEDPSRAAVGDLIERVRANSERASGRTDLQAVKNEWTMRATSLLRLEPPKITVAVMNPRHNYNDAPRKPSVKAQLL